MISKQNANVTIIKTLFVIKFKIAFGKSKKNKKSKKVFEKNSLLFKSPYEGSLLHDSCSFGLFLLLINKRK